MPAALRRLTRSYRTRRRGSLYLYVIIVSTLVSLFGVSSLMVTRIRRQIANSAADAAEARVCAQAAIRMGLHRIEHDPDWRFTYPHGIWEADVPLGSGTYTLEGTDPSDSDLTDDAEDPLTLTGIGKKGDSTEKVEITLVPAHRGYSSLNSAMHAAEDIIINSEATLNCDQIITANNVIDAKVATVNSDVEAVVDVIGNTYNGSTDEGPSIRVRTLPNPDDVFDWYVDNGTTISIGSLDVGYPNVLRNPGFENGTADWSGAGCTLSQDSSDYNSGTSSLEVTDRLLWSDGPEQDITHVLESDVKYDVQAWVKMPELTSVGVHFRIELETSSSTSLISTSSTGVDSSEGWKLITDTIVPSWSGNLISAMLRVRTDDGDLVTNFRLDDIQLQPQGSDRTIFGKLLSPSSNPYGTANPKGIYLLDMQDETVDIKFSRIFGTLVLISPSKDSRIGGGTPLNFEPAVPGLPALLVRSPDSSDDETITIDPSDRALVESALQKNFNPPGAPYQGATDTDQNDTYLSEIRGLVYGTNMINFANQPSIHGAVVASDTIEVSDMFNLKHDNRYFLSPPPGFNGPEEIRILLDSAAKPLN